MSNQAEAPRERLSSLLTDGPPFLVVAFLFLTLLAVQLGTSSPALGLAVVALGLLLAVILEFRSWHRATPNFKNEIDATFPTLRERLDKPPARPVRKLARVPGPMLYTDPSDPRGTWRIEDMGAPLPMQALIGALMLGVLGGIVGPGVGFALLAVALLVALIVAQFDWQRRNPSREAEAMDDFPTLRRRLDAANAAYRRKAKPL